jgi:uncharacterized membrane protein
VHDGGSELGQRLSPLTVMPLAIFGAAVVCDIGSQVSGVALFGLAAFYQIAAGLIVSFVALVIVLADLVTTPSGSGSRELVGTVAGAMSAMTIGFALVWCLRTEGPHTSGGWLLLCEVVAVLFGAAGAWFAQGVVIGRRRREPIQVWLPSPRR